MDADQNGAVTLDELKANFNKPKGKGNKKEVTEEVIPYTEIKNTFVLVSFK